MNTPKPKTEWYDIVKNYMPAIILLGGIFVNLVLTWKSVKDNAIDIKNLNDKVERFYDEHNKTNDNQDNDIEGLKDWIKYREGYEQAEKDFKLKH